MKLFEKKNSILIEEDDLQDARLSSIDFPDESTKKRVFMNILGARLGMKMLFSQKIEANNLYSLYTIHNVIEELDIADIYFQGMKIDVRLVFNREEIFIPKSHFKYNMLPDLYLVLELNEDFETAEFLGFFEPKTLNIQNENKDFYFYEYDRLIDPKTIKTFLKDFVVEGNFNISENNVENAEELFISLADKEISQKDKIALFKYLADDISLREKIVEFENFEVISKEIVKNKELLNDGILDVVGAQQIYENEELSPLENKAEVIGEVLTDLLEVGDSLTDEAPFVNIDNNSFDEESDDDFLESLSTIAESDDDVVDLDDLIDSETEQENNLLDEALFASQQSETDLNLYDNDEKSIDEPQTLQSFGELPDLELDNDFSQDLMLSESESQDEEVSQELQSNVLENDDLDNFDSFDEDLEDDSAIAQKYFGTLESNEQGTNFDNDDFNILEEGQDIQNDSYDNLISFDDFSANKADKNTQRTDFSLVKEDETIEKLRELEKGEDLNNNSEKSDEFISQVDEFLNEADFSDEKIELLSKEFNLDDLDEDSITDFSQSSAEAYIANNSESEDEFSIQEEPSEGNKDDIKLLFQGEKTDEMPDLNNNPKKITPLGKNKKMLVAASIASVVLVSLAISGAVVNMKNNNSNLSSDIKAPMSAQGDAPAELSQNGDTPVQDQLGQGQNQSQNSIIGQDTLTKADISPDNQQAGTSRDMGKAVTDAFMSEPVNATISKVAWEVPEDFAYNDGFRKYLQLAGRNLKLNLQNNLLLATEMAYSNKVIVDLNINKDGSLQASSIATSSGSKQIDKIVLQSVKETLKYLKMPSSELSSNSVSATLIINF